MHSILFWRPALLILLFIMFPISTHPFNLDSCPSAKAWSFTARHVYMSTQTFIWIQTLHGITHGKERHFTEFNVISKLLWHTKKGILNNLGTKKNLIVFFLEKEYVMCYVMLSVLCYKIYKTITTILLLLLLLLVVVLLLFILLIYHYSYWIAFIVLTFKLSSY